MSEEEYKIQIEFFVWVSSEEHATYRADQIEQWIKSYLAQEINSEVDWRVDRTNQKGDVVS